MEPNEKQNHFRNDEITIDPIEEQATEERTEQIDGMDQDCQKGQEENRPKEGDKQAADEGKGTVPEKEGQDPQNQAELGHPSGKTDQEDHQAFSASQQSASEPSLNQERVEAAREYSCSYTPPYYVPNFTVVNPQGGTAAFERTEKKEKKSRSNLPWVILAVVLSAMVSLILGCVGGYLCAMRFERTTGAPELEGDVTITKNDGSITVNEVVGSTGYDNLSVAEVVQYVADSVVEITTSQVQNDRFFGNYVTGGAGSGVIIDSTGYIMTNNHVIDGATSVTVRLTSGSEYEAKVVGGDADSDIAVLKIEASELKAAVMGKSSQLKVGQGVVAIGNPLGELGGTVTDGIISALDRQVIVDGYPMTLLQTNAAINPGNSGGGLFNMAGELVGIVNAKQADTGIEGLGFAIPIDVAWEKAEDLMKYGYVTGKLILDFTVEAKTSEFQLQAGNGFFAPSFTFPAGVYVVSTQNNSLQKYDRIVSINGISINGITDYYNVIEGMEKGEEMKLGISRLNTLKGRFEEHSVTLTVKVTEPSA